MIRDHAMIALEINTYIDKDAVEISRFCVIVALLGAWLSDDLRQASQPRYAQNVDVVLAAESLQEGEMNLKSDIVLVLFVRGQNT